VRFRLKQTSPKNIFYYCLVLALPALIVVSVAYHNRKIDANPGTQTTNSTAEAAAQASSAVSKNDNKAGAKNPDQSGSTPTSSQSSVSPAQAAAQAAATYAINNASSAALGVYTGPGAISAHTQFEQWLGRAVPYATDYIDYKGGWQKDFADSRLWLMEPWGNWVRSASGRRLVLGLPMLENSNNGQFDAGTRGDFDSYFSSLGNSLVSNGLGNTIIRLGYEANCNTIGPWQATDNPDGYKQLFRHIVTVMRATPGSAFSFDWTVCNGLQEGHALNSFNSFYPGDDVVNIIGMDVYDMKWMDAGATPQARWQYNTTRSMGVNELVQFARNHGKSVSFPEWGLYKPGDSFAGGGDDPYFIQQMTQLFNNTNPIYQSYFNLDWGGGVLSDFPGGQATFKTIYGH
jgi:hypothetical protein